MVREVRFHSDGFDLPELRREWDDDDALWDDIDLDPRPSRRSHDRARRRNPDTRDPRNHLADADWINDPTKDVAPG